MAAIVPVEGYDEVRDMPARRRNHRSFDVAVAGAGRFSRPPSQVEDTPGQHPAPAGGAAGGE